MSARTYTVHNGAVPAAAAAVAITTGTAIKTMMQLQANATAPAFRLVEWWTEFDGSAAATPIKVEILRHTGGPQTTLTTYAAADIAKANDPNAPASTIILASNASGFGTAATEVTPTTVSNIATHFIPPTSGIYIQYPLGREPDVQTSQYVRHRTTAGAAVNCLAAITWEE